MDQFSSKQLTAARRLKVTDLLFSQGTYQAKVQSAWPFLQLSDQGQILDAFCSCKESEISKGRCIHLAALYEKIMDRQLQPLHVRFAESFWNALMHIACEQIATEMKKTRDGRFAADDETGKQLFVLKPKGAKSRAYYEALFFERPVETEETSLKFSKLPPEELALWREGRPSSELRYELSFWADLAKHWFFLQEEGEPYQLSFAEEGEIPHLLHVKFIDAEIEVYLARVDFPRLLPSLAFIKSPLPVYLAGEKQIESIRYVPEQQVFQIVFVKQKRSETPAAPVQGTAISLDEKWLYAPKKGFFLKATDPFLETETIPKEKIDAFLTTHQKLIAKTLIRDSLHPTSITPGYTLAMAKDKTLIIETYAFKQGDLAQKGAAFFGNWIYLPKKGFFRLEGALFNQQQIRIPKEEMSDFVSRHRIWLGGFEGFATHMSTLESRLSYRLAEGKLEFFAGVEYGEEEGRVYDFGQWLYVAGKGFYARKAEAKARAVQAGAQIAFSDISRFIDSYRDELEAIPGFFAPTSPLEKAGLNIGFAADGRIEVTPYFFFISGKTAQLFGDYTYVEQEGFSRIPLQQQLPAEYRVQKKIDKRQEPYFVGYELDLLYPYITSIDPKLKKPKECLLSLDALKRDPKSKRGDFILSLSYETNLGRISPFVLWQALQEGRSYLFSEAGLLFIHSLRFEWLKGRKKKRWTGKGKHLRLSTLEFLQLLAFEEIRPPTHKKSRELYEQFCSFEPPKPIDLSEFKSTLRPYQQTGVAWLWYLSCYGLSGLLCDEMGLGKTHQAMALIAGLKQALKEKQLPVRMLVICPTSVIYHWEQLLHRFFPTLDAHLYYGPERSIKKEAELIITSYGVFRSDLEIFQQLVFNLVVFDEIQVAKNEKSKVNKALHALDAGMRLGLTGTPIENRLLELKALFDLVLPGYFPSLAHFRDLFVGPIEKHGDEHKKTLLRRLIKPFILRRKKSEVLTELPEKMEEIAYCDLSEEQTVLYHEIFRSHEQQILERLRDLNLPPPTTHIFSLLSKLKQVCDHPCLITKEVEQYKHHRSGKWDLFTQLLEEIRDSGQKVVIFSQYLDMLNILGLYLQEHQIEYAEIRGSTTDRKEQVARFQEDPRCEVFLGSLQAAGVGIDLTAASVVIHYDRWWNPAKENQASDRVHRMGQKRGVQVFKLVTRHTVEEHIHTLIESKLLLASTTIDFDKADEMKKLSREELLLLMQQLKEDVVGE
jgi:superfamily II DNA or RNA helicase